MTETLPGAAPDRSAPAAPPRTEEPAEAPGPPRTEELAPGVYAYIQPDGGWCVSNSGVLIGDDGVTVVDTTATEDRARALRAAVGALTPAPVRLVVNTHFHGDHTFGNAVVGDGRAAGRAPQRRGAGGPPPRGGPTRQGARGARGGVEVDQPPP
ncbi:MBL fold metallo-hydrolase, partial [Streptomyces sp. NPDC059810]|uniref:MBL fold metallo-hydrolase n=1 Tax=Streptomyces sp. NPDC059810 TaxID=3346956 RepID=UPI0036684D13